MERSEQINELAAALCLAQSEFKDAAKTKTNPHLKSKYADLGAVWDACKAALTKHGLSVTQLFVGSETGCLALETVLMHKSGQFVSGVLTMPMQKNDPQGYGAAATYARRYALSAILGICADDDDDGHSASQPSRTQAQQRQAVTQENDPFRRERTIQPPVANGAGLVNAGPGLCRGCHAPEGKPHAKGCNAVPVAA